MPILPRTRQILAYTLAVLAVILVHAVIGIELLIGWGVVQESRRAMARFPGDRIEALISVVECEGCTLSDRNHAVWALGQLRDKRALPVLHKYYTGKHCNHSRYICQYELRKAIETADGTKYIAPQVWRVMLGKDRPKIRKSAVVIFQARESICWMRFLNITR